MINIPDIAGCGIFDSRAALHGQVRSVTRKVRYFELEFYPEDGKSSFIDGREYPIYAGNVIVAKPGQMRSSLLHMKNHYLWLIPDDGEICSRLKELPDVLNVGVYIKEYAELFMSVRRARESGTEDSAFLAASKICELVYRLCSDSKRQSSAGGSVKNLDGVMAALDFADKNFTHHITLDDMAKAATSRLSICTGFSARHSAKLRMSTCVKNVSSTRKTFSSSRPNLLSPMSLSPAVSALRLISAPLLKRLALLLPPNTESCTSAPNKDAKGYEGVRRSTQEYALSF